LKSCLVLSDFRDMAFKVDNFNKANMNKIEGNWEDISKALRNAAILVSSFGYSRETLTSNNAVIPIAYHLLKRGLPSNFDQSGKYAAERKRIQQWLMVSLLKRAFGGQPDNVLRPIRDVLSKEPDTFPLDEIREKFKGTTKSLSFTKDDIESLLDSRYGQSYTFSVLALLYPTLDFRNTFHIDHIHPRSLFSRNKLTKRGIQGADFEFYLDNVDHLSNLQLLEGIPNQEKNDSEFETWLQETYRSKQTRQSFTDRNYIPEDVDLDLDNFREFFEERRTLLNAQLTAFLKPE
jgi:hypothetical protein